jgi:hypothetical protein
VSNRFGIFSALYCSTSVPTVGAVLVGLMMVRVSTASRIGFAARHADAFVGNWLVVPIFFERRLPFSQKKKFHVLIRLSSTTLPLLFCCLTDFSLLCEQQTAGSVYRPSPQCESAT